MSNVKISFACGLYDRMLPLYTGEVKPDGIDLDFQAIDSPRDIFDRMAGSQEFDVAELSSSEFISRMAANQCPFVAIPVFPSRVFRHGMITINTKSGIRTPKDLEGKRVGVPLYTMTAAVFIRGHLQHEYGVDLTKIHWVQGAINKSGSHGNPSVLPMARPVPIEIKDDSRTLSEMIDAGEIDAIIGTGLPESIKHNPNVRRLFPNFHEVEREFYLRTKIFPIMHLVAIRREVYERHPFVAASLYKAFDASKNAALAKMKYVGALRYMLPWMTDDLDEIEQVFGGDPWPYGLKANRPTLDALMTYMVDQGIIAKPLRLDQVFVDVGGP
jgi:4,5-dihydroxyphthalate decarboxylase